MGDSIDDLLAQLHSSSTEAPPRSKSQSSGQLQQRSQQVPQTSAAQKLPAQKPSAQKPPAQTSIDDLLEQVTSQSQPSSASSTVGTNSKFCQPQRSSSSSDDSTDRLLADLKSIYAEQDQIEQQAQKQRLRAEQERQADAQRQQAQAIRQQATAWLKTLNHQSSEAAWFEEFAAKYDSRVEAAIDYLGLG